MVSTLTLPASKATTPDPTTPRAHSSSRHREHRAKPGGSGAAPDGGGRSAEGSRLARGSGGCFTGQPGLVDASDRDKATCHPSQPRAAPSAELRAKWLTGWHMAHGMAEREPTGQKGETGRVRSPWPFPRALGPLFLSSVLTTPRSPSHRGRGPYRSGRGLFGTHAPTHTTASGIQVVVLTSRLRRYGVLHNSSVCW